MPRTCTHCPADALDHSTLCEDHHAERDAVGEHPPACICWGCARYFAQNTGLKAVYIRNAKAHPATVALCLRLPRLAALAAAGVLLTVVDVAELNARADAAREARIVALEWEAEPDAPALPGELTWMPARRSGGSAARS